MRKKSGRPTPGALQAPIGLVGHPSFDRVTAAEPNLFQATVRAVELSLLRAEVVSVEPCRWERFGRPPYGSAPQAGRGEPMLVVGIADEPSIVQTASAPAVDCPAGSLVVLGAQRPLAWTFPAAAQVMTLAVPPSALAPLAAGFAGATVLRPAPLTSATADFVRRFVIDAAVDGRAVDPAAEQSVVNLIRTALDREEAAVDPADGEVVRARAVELIDREFADPSLTAESVAAGLAMSRRHLYRYFESHGESVAQAIVSRRLDNARTLLTSDDTVSLDEIAVASGFATAATLRRRFQARYGVTPREYRRTWGAAVAPAVATATSSVRSPRRPARPVWDAFEVL